MNAPHPSMVGSGYTPRSGHPSAHAAPLRTSDIRGVSASALREAFGGASVSAIVDAFGLDSANPTHRRRVQRWLVDGAPQDAIAMLPAETRDRYLATLYPAQEAA